MAKNPEPVDIDVGERLKQIRLTHGMSQTKVAGKLGITFQQVQKYERGANRIGSSRLFQLAEMFSVPVQYFFGEQSGPSNTDDGTISHIVSAFVRSKEGVELNTSFHRIEDAAVRKAVLKLIANISKQTPSDDE